MKIKTILIIGILILLIFLIYLTTLDKKVYYLSLGDSLAIGQTPYGNIDYGYTDYIKDYLKQKKVLEKYINEFSEKNYRTTDLIRDIEDNKKIFIDKSPQTIKNALIKADLLTVSIGMNDLLYKFSVNNLSGDNIYNYIDEIMIDMDQLFALIRKYCKEDVMIVGYYVPNLYLGKESVNNYIDYANKKLKELCNDYNMNFISIDRILQNNIKYLPQNQNIYPSKLGYEAISKEIIKKIDKTLFK